jgi:hypothetical protein
MDKERYKKKSGDKIADEENPEGEDKKKEEENKFKPFTGKGVVLDDKLNKNDKNEFEGDQDMKQAYELSLMEYVKDLENNLPKEPDANDGSSYNIAVRLGDNVFARRWNGGDTVLVIFDFIIFLLGHY